MSDSKTGAQGWIDAHVSTMAVSKPMDDVSPSHPPAGSRNTFALVSFSSCKTDRLARNQF